MHKNFSTCFYLWEIPKLTDVYSFPYKWSLNSLMINSLPTHWIYQPTNDKAKPRHYGPIPSHHTHIIQSITFNWLVYLANNTHDNSLYRTLYSTHWQYRLTNDWVMSAVLVDVCKTQSFHCKKEQNVEIKIGYKIHFLWYWRGEFNNQGLLLLIDHFLFISCDRLYAIDRAVLLWEEINCWDKMC